MAAVGAAATFAGMAASGVIKVVIKEIASAIKGEFKLHKNLSKDLEKMKMTLESVEAVLSEAERRSITEQPTRLWLKRLKDALYDISDMLDDFQDDTNLLEGLVRKIKEPHKMKEMQQRLQEITKNHNDYRVPADTRSDKQPDPDTRETAAGDVKDVAGIIGRTEEKKNILACLSGSTTHEETTFLPIWGFGGIGKTTMARWIFNHSEFKDYSRVWVYVSQTFDQKKIGNTIISQLSGPSDIDDLHSVCTRLGELLTGKKTLIILDDLWEKDPRRLEDLKSMLKQGEGSKVIVVITTREESIAQEIHTVDPYNLAPLSVEMCWDIIKQKCNFEACHDKERLEPIGKEIAKKCGGVPLAAQSLGYMLKSKTYDVWASVRNNHIWNLPTLRDTLATYEVLASLLLSYNFIRDPSLKICFAYCAIFPKGHKVMKDELIYQWIALGFIEPSSPFSKWQVGESYIKQLLEMSFLQHSEVDHSTVHQREDVPRFIMHDLVHDLARSVMADDFDLREGSCRYARLTDCTESLKSSTTSPAKLRALHMVDHRLIIWDHGSLKYHKFHDDSFAPAKHLRVLDLSTRFFKDLPDSIGQLKQLRYLSAPYIRGPMDPRGISMLSKLHYLNLHGCTDISTLPESIGEMKDLIHLDLSHCTGLSALPVSIGEMKDLMRLDLSSCTGLSTLPESIGGMKDLMRLDLSRCTGLSKLPESIGEMKDLMHLDLSGCRNMKELPRSFGTLAELVYLDLSHCDTVSGIPEALGGLTKLKHLDLSGCKNLRGLPALIGCLTELRYLNLSRCMHHIFESSSADQTESFLHRICTLPIMEQLDLSCNDDYPFGIPESACRLKKMFLTSSKVTRLPECVAKMDSHTLFGLLLSHFGKPHFDVCADETESHSNLGFLEHVNADNLGIRKLENVKSLEEARRIKLSEKQSIEELTLMWTKDANRSVDDMELLRELVPPTTLQRIEINGYRSVAFPDWLTSTSSHLPNLVQMTMRDLPDCKSIPPLSQLPNLQELTLVSMKSLEEWNTTYSSGEDSVNELMFPKLEKVHIDDCPKLRIKPHLPRAASWYICGSDNVLVPRQDSVSHVDRLTAGSRAVPMRQWGFLHHLRSLEHLEIFGCSDLTISPEITGAFHSLKSLKLFSCHLANLKELFSELTSLELLVIYRDEDLEELPNNMRQLTKLQSLTLNLCPRLRQLPEWLGELTSLKKLKIEECEAIMTLPDSIQQLTNLQELDIGACHRKLKRWYEENKTKLAHIGKKSVETRYSAILEFVEIRNSPPKINWRCCGGAKSGSTPFY